jgi:putative phosphoribosyl transferase
MFRSSRSSLEFADRHHAGKALAERLKEYAGRSDVVVLALPRGGVPVAHEVACALHAPLDVFVVRKLGVPGHEELAMGAIASGDVRVLNQDVLDWYRLSEADVEAVSRLEKSELERRERLYRGSRPLTRIDGCTAILIDDGLATGSTMRAAVEAVRRLNPTRIVVAVPVGAQDTCDQLGQIADEAICLMTPASFSAVGQWYLDFSQTTDDEVRRLLASAGNAGA